MQHDQQTGPTGHIQNIAVTTKELDFCPSVPNMFIKIEQSGPYGKSYQISKNWNSTKYVL